MTTTSTEATDRGQDKILTALQHLGPATAAAIAEAAGLAYSTTTARLRALQAAGRVHRLPGGDGPARWHTTKAHTGQPPATAASSGTGIGQQSRPARGKTNRAAGEPAAAPPATGRNNRRRRATMPQRPETARAAKGTSTHMDMPGSASQHAPPHTPKAGADAGPTAARARRAKGALRSQVLAVLQDHPDQAFKVSQVARLLSGASCGAVANALDKLVADGNARQVAEKPASYQAE